MSEQKLPQIALLLERMGSIEIQTDTRHQYALRRALLNSPRFERNRLRLVWTRFFVYTGTLVAGSAVAAVLVVNVLTVELAPSRSSGPSGSSAPLSRASSQLVEAERPGTVRLSSFAQRPDVWQVLEFAKPDLQFAVSR